MRPLHITADEVLLRVYLVFQTFRAATLWKLLRVKYDKENRPVPKRAINPVTGKNSIKDVEFGIVNYGAKTAGAATSARALSIQSLDTVVRLALEISQVPPASSSGSAPQEKKKKTGDMDFALLVEARA